MKKISLVVPCYNEEAVIELFYKEICNIKNSFKNVDFEIIFVNDGSFVNEPIGSLQFKSFKNLKPVDALKIKYKDYKDKYKIM